MSDYQSFKDQKFSFKKPWLFGEYEKMQQTTDEAEIYLGEGLVTVESQFKKPYTQLDHPASENIFEGPKGTPFFPQTPWGLPGNDCMPTGSGIGGGALNPCVPQISCGQWAWTCAHRITKFGVVGNGFIQSVQYGANDTVVVTICWDENNMGGQTFKGSLVTTKDGAVFNSKVPLNCLGPGADPGCGSCLDCKMPLHAPTIHWTTLQMSTGGASQQLSASGGAGGPYKWSIIAGGGTISPNGLYTPPASNAGCANNPTIKVLDFCGNQKLLKIAVNGNGATGPAIAQSFVYASGSCAVTIRTNTFNCDGSDRALNQVCCACDTSFVQTVLPCSPPQACGSTAGCGTACLICPAPGGGCGECGGGSKTCTNSGANFSSDPGIYDKRTAGMLAAGCCPAAFL